MESHHAPDGYDARKSGRYHLDFDRRSWQDSEKLLSSSPRRVACYPDSDHT